MRRLESGCSAADLNIDTFGDSLMRSLISKKCQDRNINDLTQLPFYATNITSCYFLRTRWRPRFVLFEPEGLHFRTQAMDEMLDVKRQRRAALHRDVSIEFGTVDDAQQFNAGETAMGNGELIDDGDTKPGLDQDADRSAEPGANGDIVVELLAGKDFGHDATIGVSRINPYQRIADDFRCGYLLATRKFMAFGDDAKQLARRKGQEVEARVI